MITLPAFPTYDVLTKETVVFTIPREAVRSRQRPTTQLQFEVDAVAGIDDDARKGAPSS